MRQCCIPFLCRANNSWQLATKDYETIRAAVKETPVLDYNLKAVRDLGVLCTTTVCLCTDYQPVPAHAAPCPCTLHFQKHLCTGDDAHPVCW